MPVVNPEIARRLNEIQHQLITLHLDPEVMRHERLYGALSPTIDAVKSCATLAMRDMDWAAVDAERKAREEHTQVRPSTPKRTRVHRKGRR